MSDWIDCDEEWAYWINPETFRMPRVKERVPVGVVVLIKDREDVDGRMVVVTRYCQAAADGLHDTMLIHGAGHRERLFDRPIDDRRDQRTDLRDRGAVTFNATV